MKTGDPIFVVREDHPAHHLVGYVEAKIGLAAYGVCVVQPDGAGWYKMDHYQLFKEDLVDLTRKVALLLDENRRLREESDRLRAILEKIARHTLKDPLGTSAMQQWAREALEEVDGE